MSIKAPTLDAAFIDKQRRSLVELRIALLAATHNDEDEETGIKRESTDSTWEYEDDAQKLAHLELDGHLVVRNLKRLTVVERALSKLEEGSYGQSDVSGKPIPRARLEAVPEAICTLEEEDELERRALVGR